MDFKPQIGDLVLVFVDKKVIVDNVNGHYISGLAITKQGWHCFDDRTFDVQNNKLINILYGETSC